MRHLAGRDVNVTSPWPFNLHHSVKGGPARLFRGPLLSLPFHIWFIRVASLSPAPSQEEGNEAPPSGYNVVK